MFSTYAFSVRLSSVRTGKRQIAVGPPRSFFPMVTGDLAAFACSAEPSTEASQFDDAIKAYAQNGKTADYVIFDVGAVDFLIHDDINAFAKRYEESFVALLNIHPRARVLVLRAPDIVTLMTDPVQAPFKLPIGSTTCDKVRNAMSRSRGLSRELPRAPQS
jgi:hypothetical protein